MNRSSKTAAVAGVLVAGAIGALALPGSPAVALDRDLWGAVTIAPGREGIVEVAGHGTAAPGAGATLTLTAPRGTRVTGMPLDGSGYRGSVAADGRSATYTVTGGAARQPWRGRTFPFVLAVPADAVPGTRLPGCVLRTADAQGVREAAGRCAVTVGLAGPTLTRPESGVPLGARPEIAGTAHPGARVSVQDKHGDEACSTTAARDGTWACTPRAAFPVGANRLQAVAALNGVSATSEQIHITVAGAGQ